MKRRQFNQAGLALVASALAGPFALQTAIAQNKSKPLIERWLDGETKANYGTAVTYTGAPISLKYSSFLAPSSVLALLLIRAFKRLEADTNGKIVVRPFWGNTLANAQRGAFEAIAGGVADFGQAYFLFDLAGSELFQGLQLPFLFEDSLQSSWTAMELYPKYLRKEYESKGVYLIRIDTTRPLQLFTINQPIQTLDDLKGKRVWSPGSLSAQSVRALGGVPSALQTTEVYTAFQSGVVDVVPTHDAGAELFRFAELAKYRTVVNLWVQNTETGINKQVFDRLPADLKKIFYHWAQLWNQVEVHMYYEQEALAAITSMQKRNIRSLTLPPQEREKWIAATQPVVDQFIAEKQAKGLPAREFVADMKALAAKYKGRTGDDITQQLLARPIPGLIAF